jgi:hypothetical protein
MFVCVLRASSFLLDAVDLIVILAAFANQPSRDGPTLGVCPSGVAGLEDEDDGL